MARSAGERESPPRVRLVDGGPHEPGALLLVDEVSHSHVDTADPRVLRFDYMRYIADVVDLVAEPPARLEVLHLGGGAGALARAIALRRPGSRQLLVELDPDIVELVGRELPYPARSRIRTLVRDAREALGEVAPASLDVVVTDVFDGAQVPATVTSREFVALVRRGLRPGGCYAMNVADSAPLGFARAQAATLLEQFPCVLLVAEPSVLRGRRWGNLVFAASDRPIPVDPLRRRYAASPFPARVVHGDDLLRFTGGAKPVTDRTAVASPLPPRTALGAPGSPRW